MEFKNQRYWILGWFKYAKNAKIKNHHRSTVAMVQNDGPDVIKLVPASTQLEQEPFQHSGVRQHHQQALGVFFGSEIEILCGNHMVSAVFLPDNKFCL